MSNTYITNKNTDYIDLELITMENGIPIYSSPKPKKKFMDSYHEFKIDIKSKIENLKDFSNDFSILPDEMKFNPNSKLDHITSIGLDITIISSSLSNTLRLFKVIKNINKVPINFTEKKELKIERKRLACNTLLTLLLVGIKLSTKPEKPFKPLIPDLSKKKLISNLKEKF